MLRSTGSMARTQPLERFWPYVDKPEEPTAEELAALDPDLHAALFGPRSLPFFVSGRRHVGDNRWDGRGGRRYTAGTSSMR